MKRERVITEIEEAIDAGEFDRVIALCRQEQERLSYLMLANGISVLAACVYHGCGREHVDALVALGQDLRTRTPAGRSLLYLARFAGDAELADYLEAAGLSTDPFEDAALALRAQPPDIETALCLIREQPDIVQQTLDTGAGILILATHADSIAVVQAALGAGADPRLGRRDIGDALCFARSQEIAERLIAHGASPRASENLTGQTILTAAVLRDLELMDYLLSQGADPNMRLPAATDQADAERARQFITLTPMHRKILRLYGATNC